MHHSLYRHFLENWCNPMWVQFNAYLCSLWLLFCITLYVIALIRSLSLYCTFWVHKYVFLSTTAWRPPNIWFSVSQICWNAGKSFWAISLKRDMSFKAWVINKIPNYSIIINERSGVAWILSFFWHSRFYIFCFV